MLLPTPGVVEPTGRSSPPSPASAMEASGSRRAADSGARYGINCEPQGPAVTGGTVLGDGIADVRAMPLVFRTVQVFADSRRRAR